MTHVPNHLRSSPAIPVAGARGFGGFGGFGSLPAAAAAAPVAASAAHGLFTAHIHAHPSSPAAIAAAIPSSASSSPVTSPTPSPAKAGSTVVGGDFGHANGNGNAGAVVAMAMAVSPSTSPVLPHSHPSLTAAAAAAAAHATHSVAVAKAAKAVVSAPVPGVVPNATAAQATAPFGAPAKAAAAVVAAPATPFPVPSLPTSVSVSNPLPSHKHAHTPTPTPTVTTAAVALGPTPSVQLVWCLSGGLMYSAHFSDQFYDYRLVQLPPAMTAALCSLFHRSELLVSLCDSPTSSSAGSSPSSPPIGSASPASLCGHGVVHHCVERLLNEAEWRSLGIQQSVGWQHFGWWPTNAVPVQPTPALALITHTHKLTLLFRRLRGPLMQLPVAALSAVPASAPASAADSDDDEVPRRSAVPMDSVMSTHTSSGAPIPAAAAAAAAAAHAIALQNHKLRVQLETLSAPELHLKSCSSRRSLIPPPYRAPRSVSIATK